MTSASERYRRLGWLSAWRLTAGKEGVSFRFLAVDSLVDERLEFIRREINIVCEQSKLYVRRVSCWGIEWLER